MNTMIEKPLEWNELWTAMQRDFNTDPGSIRWFPTTEEMYRQMLEAVPPAAYGIDAFLVGEAWTHRGGTAIYAAFWKQRPGNYLAKYMSKGQFEASFGTRDELKKWNEQTKALLAETEDAL